MGWASGTDVADDLYDLLVDKISKKKMIDMTPDVIEIFECHDCDNMCESKWWEIYEENYDSGDE